MSIIVKFIRAILVFLFVLAQSVTSLEQSSKYSIKACLVDTLGESCDLLPISKMYYTKQPTKNNCEENVGQRGSVSWVDLTLPFGKVLLVHVTTNVSGQSSENGFFVRPTRRTRQWGRADTQGGNSASFYLAETGQFSVEFVSDKDWRNYDKVTMFHSLMLFVNPEAEVPNSLTVISPNTNQLAIDLGPNKEYLFAAGVDYDWGRDQVFKVHDNTSIYFETGAIVRGRIVQTEKKVKNVLISGYGILDSHYDLEPDLSGISDDATRQNIGIYGKNIQVFGVTLINTNPTCGSFGYCLNINANWSPLADEDNVFDAYDLQLKDPPFDFHQAHCQEKNMDDSLNTDFTNCPTSYENGQSVSYVKCMTWQMGQDGLNAGKYGAVENSFVRANDDAIKPWDSFGMYKNITIWQMALGWPINFGWWNWNQPDVNTVIDNIYVIHNHNWVSSPGWPETKSGQCIVGGIYGSGAVKKGYKLSNIFVETAASCAIGLQISKSAYSRHPTLEGCVASMIDFDIDGMFFDEEFFQTGSGTNVKYGNYLSGETQPNTGCANDLSGKIENLSMSGIVAGRALSQDDFVVIEPNTVTNLNFQVAEDPHPTPSYDLYSNMNAYNGNGGIEIDENGVDVLSFIQCTDRCHADWSCECVTFQPSSKLCWKLRGCNPDQFDVDQNYQVYVRPQSPKPPSASFFSINEGECSMAGGTSIASKADCQDAATYLDFADVTASVKKSKKKPKGCWYNTKNNKLFFNTKNSKKKASSKMNVLCRSSSQSKSPNYTIDILHNITKTLR